ncbi:hypothetical protein K469DRAFT_710031 [Zopfia rhizophila CBS 207.26]|uniref:Uncharacterized protein n=1 Tax=Zopfia rhizophila CBS 207.26 TaxID=1314779 RepID=A0A6A6E0W3_9PEZI|nr:hypothetical protein K469DRAFT_710031 [Zopfia rhizophila CBS 207.26]
MPIDEHEPGGEDRTLILPGKPNYCTLAYLPTPHRDHNASSNSSPSRRIYGPDQYRVGSRNARRRGQKLHRSWPRVEEGFLPLLSSKSACASLRATCRFFFKHVGKRSMPGSMSNALNQELMTEVGNCCKLAECVEVYLVEENKEFMKVEFAGRVLRLLARQYIRWLQRFEKLFE